jgi:cytochrome c556
MKRTILIAALFAFALAGAVFAQQKEHPTPDEIKAEVPVLADFHEVIYPLWHQAWPNKDYKLIKELLPQVEKYTVDIEKTELPGILRDKVDAWKEGVKNLRASADKMRQAVASGHEQGQLDAVETLHSNYEKLVRTVRPRMKELEAYHQVLYQVYHYYMPQKQVKKLREAAMELLKKGEELKVAATPKKLASKEQQYKDAVAKLYASTVVLSKKAMGKSVAAIEKAVEVVHTDYQALDGMFE